MSRFNRSSQKKEITESRKGFDDSNTAQADVTGETTEDVKKQSQVLSILACMKGAHIVTDGTGAIIQVNADASEILGYRSTELTGKRLEMLLPPGTRRKQDNYQKSYQPDHQPEPMGSEKNPYLIVNGASEPVYLDVDLTPITLENGTIITATTLHDVTENILITRLLEHSACVGVDKGNSEQLTEIARIISNELMAAYVSIGRILPDRKTIQTEVSVIHGKQEKNFKYPIKGTPCADTINRSGFTVTGNLTREYPDDTVIRKLNAKSYVGLAFTDKKNEPKGIINILYDRAIPENRAKLCKTILRVASIRIMSLLATRETDNTINKLMKSVELSPNGVAITDSEANIEYVNTRYCELTGFTPEECLGKKPSINASGGTPRETYDQMWQTILGGEVWQGELQNRKKDGSNYWARTKIFPITDSNNTIIHFVSIQEDISRDKELTARLVYEATHDQLTELFNRREFERKLDEAVSSSAEHDAVHSICFIDLDHFKVINDTSGHTAGDILIRKVASILKDSVRSIDMAARVGGDEFGLILHNCSSDQAYPLAQRILERIQNIDFRWEGKKYTVSCSIGIAEIAGEERKTADVIRMVDTACYAAKEKGRGNIHIYHQNNRASYKRLVDSDWIPEINAAFANEHFVLYAQPIVSLAKAKIPNPDDVYYYEILVRMLDANGRLVSPSEFFPTLERYSMATRMDRYILDHIFDWAKANPHFMEVSKCLGINLSGNSLTDSGLLDYIIDRLSSDSLPASKFKFEITETSAIANIVEAKKYMSRLRALGCEVVLDDFGSGLSSFSYLKNLPIDVIKIDGDMIREITTDHRTFIMVKTINEMAHNLGCTTVAEYVEDLSILNQLSEIGIDYAQGYAIDYPQSIDSLVISDQPDCQES